MSQEYKRIFAALDGSPAMVKVARKAVNAAAANRAELLFGNVIDSVPDALTPADYRELCEKVRLRLEDELADVLADARASERIPSVRVEVKPGQIKDTLVKHFIKPFDPDLVICGERGFSDIKYVFVGSTSTYLIRNLRCDVLVVKQD